MTGLTKLTSTELKLWAREPVAVFFTLLFPPVLLAVLGAIPPFREPQADLGGLRVIDLYVPIVITMAIAMSALNGLPAVLATYRERGILRRIATTPARPATVLTAELLMFALITAGVAIVLVVIGALAFDVALPQQPVGYVLAYGLSLVAMLSLGLLVTALVPTSSAAFATGQILFFPLMFFSGLWFPRAAMPDWLRTVSDFTPLGAGAQAMTDTGAGDWPQLLHIAVLLVWTAVSAALAAKLFRWE